ncbi:MAG: hypothetical protein ACHQDB_09855 [Steroidobacterales bacterium]
MGWRKTGTFHAPQEILVMTCDVCERDIGYEDERRPRAHFEVVRLPNPGALDVQNPATYICSPQCLRAFAAKAWGEPERLPPGPVGAKPRAKPTK